MFSERMRLTLIGSTGRTGRHVLAEAQRLGQQVTAFTRRPRALRDADDLTIVEGDGRDPDAVGRAIADADAVVAIVAAATRKGPHHAAAVAECVVGAMRAAGVERLVVTSAYPIVGNRPRLSMAILRRLFAHAYADLTQMERIVSTSPLAWTIVRLNRLTDKEPKGSLEISTEPLQHPRSLARADVGVLLANIAVDGSYARSAVNVSGAGR
jgi:uncharacterized protein YbjT (DUF2867 family)